VHKKILQVPLAVTHAAACHISFAEQDKPRAKKKNSKISHRKYDEAYIEWGFSCTPDVLQPLCVIFV
jgi:hypothetical protein